MTILQVVRRVAESNFIVLTGAFILALVFSNAIAPLANYTTVLLGTILFFSALKIDIREVVQVLKGGKMIVAVLGTTLILLPILVYLAAQALVPSMAISLLLLAAMPPAMVSPLLAELSGGKQSLALVLTVVGSLVAPITIPFVVQIALGESVQVDFVSMFLSLAQVVFIPFVLANGVKYFFPKQVARTEPAFASISIIVLGLLIAGIVAVQAGAIIEAAQGPLWGQLAILFGLFLVLHIAGWVAAFWRSDIERITTSITVAYMSFTLALFVANEFFNTPDVVLPIILAIIPWMVLIGPFKRLVQWQQQAST